jgi:hypothetical protein
VYQEAVQHLIAPIAQANEAEPNSVVGTQHTAITQSGGGPGSQGPMLREIST